MLSNMQMKNLFLRQSYLDSWEDYENSLRKVSFIKWDYLILTASNEEQAITYREQIDYRRKQGLLPAETHYAVLPDPDGCRVGSGGATFNVLRYIAQQESGEGNFFKGKRILVIHSGGDSKRVPQYSACGKLFSPVPRELPNGFASTLFDEFVIGMSGVPSRIPEGMLILSGDVLLLFNPLQIDFNYRGAAAISIKENVMTGKDHGVFLNDGNDYVGQFLHKQSEDRLRELGAVNSQGNVDLDTGAVIFDTQLLYSLFELISTDGRTDELKFQKYVNDKARISFYGDFLYPLARSSTLEQYYEEAAEGTLCEELMECRTGIWNALKPYSMKLICLSPAEFIHFGTTRELLKLLTEETDDYVFLDWKKQVMTTAAVNVPYAAHNSYVGKRAQVGSGSYLEDSYILDETIVGEGSVISGVKLRSRMIPPNTVLHGLRLLDGTFAIRTYGVNDNPKGTLEHDTPFLRTTLRTFMEQNALNASELWDSPEKDGRHYLWFARLYPVSGSAAFPEDKTDPSGKHPAKQLPDMLMDQAVDLSLIVCRMAQGSATPEEIETWKNSRRESLFSSFNTADVLSIGQWQHELEDRILASKFVWALEAGAYYKDALKAFGAHGISEAVYEMLMEDAEKSAIPLKIRIYYALSQYMRDKRLCFGGDSYDVVEARCFQTIQKTIYDNAASKLPTGASCRIVQDKVTVELPVRVNWGGGWTDTPPHCNECGGVVLNAALKLNGIFPVQITVEKLEELHIEFASTDIGAEGFVETVEEIQDCHNPYDSFALHKAALIACGIIPLESTDTAQSLTAILEGLGGGIRLSTCVIGIPQGSGLGTSSILSGACVKGLFQFMGRDISDEGIYEIVLCMEQIMSTGGGWQDQVGGLTAGVKYITTLPGIDQCIHVEKVVLSEETRRQMQERFALIYTGQRRLARNLLRDVVGGYLGGRPESIDALDKMQRKAVLMKFELERGNIDAFAELLNEHWELSKQLDAGSTNTCIDQIFTACEELIDARFIAGAGGGGFLQVILKKGVTRQMLRDQLHEIFQESGVDVWESEFIY